MTTDPNSDTNASIARILRERLDQFKVPLEVRDEIQQEILNLMGRPERKPFGACTMTESASLAADIAMKTGKPATGDDSKPIIM